MITYVIDTQHGTVDIIVCDYLSTIWDVLANPIYSLTPRSLSLYSYNFHFSLSILLNGYLIILRSGTGSTNITSYNLQRPDLIIVNFILVSKRKKEIAMCLE